MQNVINLTQNVISYNFSFFFFSVRCHSSIGAVPVEHLEMETPLIIRLDRKLYKSRYKSTCQPYSSIKPLPVRILISFHVVSFYASNKV